jgi:prolyl-tRNA editing enzyme YbaK/EbsC (Cys-tRNA(Pro) deacylase)
MSELDQPGIARCTLEARKVPFASMERAVMQIDMEYGAITPIGLPENRPILVYKRVVSTSYVIAGSGLRKSKIIVRRNLLASLPNTRVLEGLGLTK